MKNDKVKAALVLLVTTVIWGLGYSGVEYGLLNGWGVFPILFVRTFVGALIVLLFIFKKPIKDPKMLLFSSICGLCGFLGLTFQSFGQRISTISETSFLTSLYLIFTPVIAQMFNNKKEKIYVYICVLVSILGCFLLNVNFPFEFDKNHFLGNMLTTIGAIFFALQICFITKFTQNYDCMSMTFIELISMAFYSLIAMVIFNDFSINVNKGCISIVFVGIFSSGFASFFQMYGNKRLPESISGLIQGLESVTGMIFAMIIFNEVLNIIKVIGCLLIVSSAVFGSLMALKNEKEKYKNGMLS